uniref:Uncharacterized protein n=1 Tax=Heterosigma akashiwo TaxID=2829 RepID=A0A6S9EKQ4_HETAK
MDEGRYTDPPFPKLVLSAPQWPIRSPMSTAAAIVARHNQDGVLPKAGLFQSVDHVGDSDIQPGCELSSSLARLKLQAVNLSIGLFVQVVVGNTLKRIMDSLLRIEKKQGRVSLCGLPNDFIHPLLHQLV